MITSRSGAKAMRFVLFVLFLLFLTLSLSLSLAHTPLANTLLALSCSLSLSLSLSFSLVLSRSLFLFHTAQLRRNARWCEPFRDRVPIPFGRRARRADRVSISEAASADGGVQRCSRSCWRTLYFEASLGRGGGAKVLFVFRDDTKCVWFENACFMICIKFCNTLQIYWKMFLSRSFFYFVYFLTKYSTY